MRYRDPPFSLFRFLLRTSFGGGQHQLAEQAQTVYDNRTWRTGDDLSRHTGSPFCNIEGAAELEVPDASKGSAALHGCKMASRWLGW